MVRSAGTTRACHDGDAEGYHAHNDGLRRLEDAGVTPLDVGMHDKDQKIGAPQDDTEDERSLRIDGPLFVGAQNGKEDDTEIPAPIAPSHCRFRPIAADRRPPETPPLMRSSTIPKRDRRAGRSQED